MAETHKPLVLSRPLSPETLAKFGAQKVPQDKADTEYSQTNAPLKVPQESQLATSRKRSQVKEPLTENERVQIQTKHKAIEKTFALLLERFPDAFNLEACKPLHIPLPQLQELFKGELSKTVKNVLIRNTYARKPTKEHY